jgi:hypothetical protein
MIRNHALIQGLVVQGHEVEFLCLNEVNNVHNQEPLIWHENVTITTLNNQNEFNNLQGWTQSNSSSLKKKLKMLIKSLFTKFSVFDSTYYILKKVESVRINHESYDLILSSSDPKTSHILAKKVIQQGVTYKKWIQYWGDPLAEDITNKTIYSKRTLKKVEANLFDKANHIIYVSPITLQQQIKNFPQFSNKLKFFPIPYANKTLSQKIHTNNIAIGYFGDYYDKFRNIMPLYNVINTEKNYHLRIVGNTNISLQPTEHIELSNRLPKNKVDELESETDVLVCLLNNKGTQIPGKIFHYAATDKPIIVLYEEGTDPRIINYLASINRFILCKNNETEVKQVLNDANVLRCTYKPVEQFDSKNVANQLLKLIDEENEC